MQNFNQIKSFGDYKIVDFIGSGATGIVYKCINIETGELSAVKMIAKNRIKHKEYLEIEINLIQKLQNPFIVKFKGYEEHNRQYFIILEFMENGSLADMIKSLGILKEGLIKKVIFQVLQGLQYLHKNNIIHRDIKGGNILLDKNFEAKLSDFGVAKIIEDDTDNNNQNSFVGTPYWMAPEMIDPNTPRTAKVDIWSLGCTVIECLTGKPPYADLNQYNAFFKILEENSPDIPQNVSLECQDFLRQCFQKDPNKRPLSTDLLKHSWFNSLFKNRARLKSRNSVQFKVPENNTQINCLGLKLTLFKQYLTIKDLKKIKEFYETDTPKKLEQLEKLFCKDLYHEEVNQDEINLKLLEILEVLLNYKQNEIQLFQLIQKGVLNFIFANIDLSKQDQRFTLRGIAFLGSLTLLEKSKQHSYLSLPIYLKKFVKILKFNNLQNLQNNEQMLKVSINICLNAFHENLKRNQSIFACQIIFENELLIYLMIWLNLNWQEEFQQSIEIKILDIFLLTLQIIGGEKEIKQNNNLKTFIEQDFILEVFQKEFTNQI